MNAFSPPRARLGHVPIDPLRFEDALAAIARLVGEGRGGTVFTPNVDHVVLCESDVAFRQAYAATRLSLVDGTPVLWACRWLGLDVPEKVSGSDLVVPLLRKAAHKGWRVFFVGAREETARRAADRLQRENPGLDIVGRESPLIDMRDPPGSRAALLDRIGAAKPDLVLVALGSPKGELWAHESAAALSPAVIIGVGASLDFIAGTARRAPAWMSRSGLEWLYRLALEPRRLWRRYLLRDPAFLRVVFRAWRDGRRPPTPIGEGAVAKRRP